MWYPEGSVSVVEFFKLLNDKPRVVKGFASKLSSNADLVEYLNELSEAVGKEQSTNGSIHFVSLEDKIPEYPETKCHPDFAAIKLGPKAKLPPSIKLKPKVTSQSRMEHEVVWSQLEATGERYSEGLTEEDAVTQGASSTGYLLQARPDLVSVVGILIHSEMSHFWLYFTDVLGVCYTGPIEFDSEIATPLLGAWIRHLYNPELRCNITRVGSFPDKPTFTVDTKDMGEFTGCVLLNVGSPFHRRSVVFAVPPPSPLLTPLVIKSQYVGRRREEGSILRKIHEPCDFPGVVRLLPATAMQRPATVEREVARPSRGPAANVAEEAAAAQTSDKGLEPDMAEQDSTAEEEKRETILVLQDKAEPLMDAETPLEALIAIYDLLEVTRFLYKIHKIFHRDISAGNVLLREKNWQPEKPFEDKFGNMCFAIHLLGRIGPNPNASRLYTRVVLIDFHQAEDRLAETTGQATDRSGTPMFMARLVRNQTVAKFDYSHSAMPQLQGCALKRYDACVSNRIVEFPKNHKRRYEIAKETIDYSHRLSYDAESILWLLLWWAIQVQPRTGDHQNQIAEDLWVDLTTKEGTHDPRRKFMFSEFEDACHPDYQGLDELLLSLFEQLWGYQEQIVQPRKEQDAGRMKEEYLHEAFQRTIFDFIVKNIEQPFMKMPISPTRRPKEGGGMAQSIRTPGKA